jgi:phosphoserine phosphatase RsbU/P
VSSALLACYLQGALSAAASSPQGIKSAMESINRFFGDRAGSGKYATIFYGILDRQGRFTYINAGHCAPIVLSTGGAIQRIAATSMPVGLLPSAEFATGERQLAAGDKVVIFSDGVTEAESPSEEFYGFARLHRAVRSHAKSSSEQLHDAILEDVRTFTQDMPQADDITVVVFEYVPA